MTKADELALWKSIMAQLPPSGYLAMYLEGSTEWVQRALETDMPCNPFAHVKSLKDQAVQEANAYTKLAATAKQQYEALAADLARCRRELGQCRDEMRRVKEQATTLARIADECYSKAVGHVLAHIP